MRRRLAGMLVVLSALAACASPPDAERQQAEAAISAARQADAAKYAPDELHAAEAALTKYADAVSQRDYREALSDALDARSRADEAAKQAGLRKAAARHDAEQLIGQMDALTKTASAKLSGAAGPRPAGAAADRLRTTLRAAVRALQEARTSLSRGEFDAVSTSLTPALEALRREVSPPEAPESKRRR